MKDKDKYIKVICNKLTAANIRYVSGNVLEDARPTVFSKRIPAIAILEFLPEHNLQGMAVANYSHYCYLHDVTRFWAECGFLKADSCMLESNLFFIRHNRYVSMQKGNFVLHTSKDPMNSIGCNSIPTLWLQYLSQKFDGYMCRSKLVTMLAFAAFVDACGAEKEIHKLLLEEPYILYNFVNQSLTHLKLHLQYQMQDLGNQISCNYGNIPYYRRIHKIIDSHKHEVYFAIGHDTVQIQYRILDCAPHVLTIRVPDITDMYDVKVSSRDFMKFKEEFYTQCSYEDVLRILLLAGLKYIGVNLTYSGCYFADNLSIGSYNNIRTESIVRSVESLYCIQPDMF